jgi:Flp pilus assembly protein TadD
MPAQRSAFWQRTGLFVLLLLLFGIAARLPALHGELIWDDHLLVENNPMIRSPLLTVEAFRHYLFPDAVEGHYRPVQTLSYIFDYYFWGIDTFGFHLSNICWHATAGLLLYLLLRRIFPTIVRSTSHADAAAYDQAASKLGAFVVALIWMIHPVHSAAIDYISGRADSLVFVFAAGGWLLYLQARVTKRIPARSVLYVLASASALLALCSRESGLMWMLVFLLYVFAFEKATTWRGKIAVLSTCVVLLLLYAGLRQIPESRAAEVAPSTRTVGTTAVLMSRALGDYGRLMLAPTNLHVERTVAGPIKTFVDFLAIGGAVLLAGFIYGARRDGRGRQARIFGAGWFIITYLPVSNLVHLNATVAEHWLYLPSVGFLIFAFGVVIDLPVRYWRPAIAFASFAVLALTARSAIRSSDWVDAETFFRRTFAAGGSNSRIGVNLAVIYARRGENAKAEAILRKVLQVSPNYALARNNLALALAQQGKKDEADEFFRTANSVATPNSAAHEPTWDAALHLARLRYNDKDTPAALAIVGDARRAFPRTWELVRFESEILRATQGPEAALLVVEEFASQKWWHAGASLALGQLLAEQGEFVRASAAFSHASRLDVHDARALNLLASVKMKQERFDEACTAQRRALANRPDEPRQYLMLSEILTKMGRPDEARALLVEVSHMQAAAEAQAATR